MDIESLYSLRTKAVFTFTNGQNIESSFKKRYPEKSMNYNDISQLIQTIDAVRISRNWNQLEALLDIENILTYYAVSSLITHWDGIQKNCYIWKSSESGKFKMIPWDLDNTFQANQLSTDSLQTYNNGLIELLLENQEYKVRYSEIQRSLWDSNELTTIVDQLAEQICSGYKNDPYLSAFGCNLDDEVQLVKEYIYRVDAML